MNQFFVNLMAATLLTGQIVNAEECSSSPTNSLNIETNAVTTYAWRKITSRGIFHQALSLGGENYQPIKLSSGSVVDVRALLLSKLRQATDEEPKPIGVLDLGEGRSSFTRNLILEREVQIEALRAEKNALTDEGELKELDKAIAGLEERNLVAVDLAYPKHDDRGQILDERKPGALRYEYNPDEFDRSMIPVIQRYPLNFKSQSFQELDIKDSTGNRMKFGLIFSNHAFNYVMEKAPLDEARKSLNLALEHLADDGVMIINPFPDSRDDIDWIKEFEQLKTRGAISDYSITKGTIVLLGPKVNLTSLGYGIVRSSEKN